MYAQTYLQLVTIPYDHQNPFTIHQDDIAVMSWQGTLYG